MRDQNDYLRQQLHALDRGAAARRRKFVLLVVRCGRCGDVLAEVVDLVPYPVVRHRRAEDHPGAGTPPSGSTRERIAHRRTAGEPIRQGEWMFYPIPHPVPASGDSETVTHTVCRCRQVTLTEAEVYAWVHAPLLVQVVR
jgi:hypothetical protein